MFSSKVHGNILGEQASKQLLMKENMWRHVHAPGRMELIRTPLAANSKARSCVSLSWAALAAPYAWMEGWLGMIAATEEMLTTEPCNKEQHC